MKTSKEHGVVTAAALRTCGRRGGPARSRPFRMSNGLTARASAASAGAKRGRESAARAC